MWFQTFARPFFAIRGTEKPAGGKHDNIGASDIRLWHRAKGWRDIWYHYVIKRDGTVEKGRPDDQPGAHEPRINARSIAVCLVGGSPPIGSAEYKKGLGENNYTPAQWASLKTLDPRIHVKHPKEEFHGQPHVHAERRNSR